MSERMPEENTGPAPERRPFGPDFLTELFRNPLDPGYADAAERRAGRGPRTGWRRTAVRTVSLLTVGLIGFLLVVAYRKTVAEEPGRSRARAGLVAQVNHRQSVTDGLQETVDRLRVEVARQRDAALTDTAAARLRDLEAATGLAKVTGDGVVVRVDDAPSRPDGVTGEKDTELGQIYDRDLQHIANALWSVGAEAIAINGQRLTTMSTIRAAGRAILVDFRPVTRPYEVAAIGPDNLERRFAGTATARLFRSLVDIYGISYQLRAAEKLVLPAAAEPQLHYAQPPTTGARPSKSPAPSSSPSGGRR